jgi:putative flippase GtrA
MIKKKSDSYVELENRKLIYKKKTINPIILFWNWGWNIYYDNPELWNYLIVGGLTTVVGVGSKFLLLKSVFDQTNGLELQLAELTAWIIAVLFAYVTNRIFVFKSHSKNIIKEFISFVSGRVVTQIIQMLIMFIFVTLLALNSDGWVLLFSIICQIMQIVLNYVISKLFIFKKGA